MDPVTGSALIAGAGAASAFGQYKANRENIAYARENRDWMERMANTAHQREVADLRAAGLNPILSALGRGADTPSPSSPVIGNIAEGAGASALAIARLKADLANVAADTEAKKASAAASVSNANLAESTRANVEIDSRRKNAEANVAEAQEFSALNKLRAEQRAPEFYGQFDAIFSRVSPALVGGMLGAGIRGAMQTRPNPAVDPFAPKKIKVEERR